MSMTELTIGEIEEAISPVKLEKVSLRSRVPSAVIVPLLTIHAKMHLLFIKRVMDDSPHAGQISFPGGCKEEGDPDLLATALRETEEEIGIKRDQWRIIGSLDPTATRTTPYIIYPYVAHLLRPSEFEPNPEEVERIFTVPLNFILEHFPSKEVNFMYKEKVYNTLFVEYHGEIIWGATARILDNLCHYLNVYLKGRSK